MYTAVWTTDEKGETKTVYQAEEYETLEECLAVVGFWMDSTEAFPSDEIHVSYFRWPGDEPKMAMKFYFFDAWTVDEINFARNA